jgi:N-acetylglucosaminyldiphosphoundecaprenol N-acetyl-beta-D-mannosaminyltransferase
MGIALRAIPASLAKNTAPQAPERLTLLRFPIDNLTMREANEAIMQLAQQQTPHQVCFVNAHCVNIARKNTEYTELLDRAALVLADGLGIRLAASFSNQRIRENVNGTDLLPYLCESLRKQRIGVYLLGGKPGVAEAAATKLTESYPGLDICGCRDGYFTSEEEPQLISAIRDSGARVLLVALGVPQQELWISRNLAALGVGVAIGVGGLLDFCSGRIPRAPTWMRELGLEWLYRLQQEPKRMWKRYLVGNFVFLSHVARERMTSIRAQGPEFSE